MRPPSPTVMRHFARLLSRKRRPAVALGRFAVLDTGLKLRLANAAQRAAIVGCALHNPFSRGVEMLMTSVPRGIALAIAAACVATVMGPAPATAQDVIKIGAPLPLTGPLAPEGLKQKRGYDLWAEAANAKGGIKAGGKTYKVEIVYTDYASNTPRAVQATERMITEDTVNFVVP